MLNHYTKLSDTTKGIILTEIGTLLLLYTLGLFTRFIGLIIALIALGMIALGFVRADLYLIL